MFETTDSSKEYFIGAPTWVALGVASLVAVLCLSTLNENVLAPLTQQREAASWKESPCVIESSRLALHKFGITTGSGSRLAAEVTFRYTATFPYSPAPMEYTSGR